MTKLSSIISLFICFAVYVPKLKANTIANVDSLYSTINAELEYRIDTSRYFILEKVRLECERDFDCLYETYKGLMSRFEASLDLSLSFFINQEIINISREAKEVEKLVLGYKNQGRYANALNDIGIAFSSFEKASEIAVELGNKELELDVKALQYYELLNYSSEYIFDITTIDSLLEEIQLNIGKGTQYGLLSCGIALEYTKREEYDLAQQYLAKIADIDEPTIQLKIAEIESEIASRKNEIEKAIRSNLNVIRIANKHDALSSEINALLNLTRLEWDTNNRIKANEYLSEVSNLLNELTAVDLKAKFHKLRYEFNAENGDYVHALMNLEKKIYYEKIWDNQNKGFNAYQYYLEKEKRSIQAERERQRKEKRTSYIIIVLSILSSGLMTAGFFYQQQKKKQLSIQNKKIKDQATRLKNIDQTKSRFFANISHELRTPITLIKGPLNTLAKAPDLNANNYKLLQLAKENTGNLERLVNSILDLSKIEAGRMVLKEEPEALYDLSRRIVSNFESHAQRNDIQLRFEYLANDQLYLQLDKGKLETVLNNLLSNAIKFTDQGGYISVKVEDRRKDILIIIEDNGRGISSTDIPYIFNRYFQSEMEHTPSEGGTGIGLAFAKELIDLMQGKIMVSSEVGRGTTFTIELPRKEILGVRMRRAQVIQQKLEHELEKVVHRETALIESDSLESSFIQRSDRIDKKKILLVEDNSSIQDYIRIILEDQFNIDVTGNGQEAIDYLNETSGLSNNAIPDLIISDVMMPFMDGFQFVEKIKADMNLNQIPVIILTARADTKDKLKALRIGVDDYLLKPFDEEELKVRVENLLSNYDARSSSIYEEKQVQDIPVFSKEDMEWLAMFEAYISKNHTQQILNIPKIAFDMNMSESSLLRKLKQLTGLSPAKYLQEVRLEKAMTFLVSKTFNSISKVAVEVGYSDTRAFSRSFKNRYGKSPSEYLRS